MSKASAVQLRSTISGAGCNLRVSQCFPAPDISGMTAIQPAIGTSMASRDYSPHQQKIIRRYYDNREQIDQQRLAELVTSLYLAPEKKKARLWEQAEEAMQRLKVPAARITHVVAAADPAILADVVQDIQNGNI
ncbi:MAG: hypothetical protein VB858_19260 [Planctomycetaceae bacterium]